jgi:cytosine/adenosine deaminase-related metal-dependent hydrolase
VRQSLELATLGGATLLGRADEIGSLAPGKLADIALWRLDTLPHANIADPVAALVLGAPAPVELLIVNGEIVVERDRVVTVDEPAVLAAASQATAELLARAAGPGQTVAG